MIFVYLRRDNAFTLQELNEQKVPKYRFEAGSDISFYPSDG